MTEAAVSRRNAPQSRGDVAWRTVADVLRVVAVLSAAFAGWWFGAAATSLFVLAFAGMLVPRRVAAPGALDAAFCAAVLVAAWSGELGWYDAVGWLDLAVHAVLTSLVAAVAFTVLVRWGAVGPSTAPHVRAGVGVLVVGVGALGSVLWELAEWYGWSTFDRTIHVGYTDTLGDLAAGVLGSAVAAVPLARRWQPTAGPA